MKRDHAAAVTANAFVAILALLAISACQPPPRDEPVRPPAAAWKSCTHPKHGFSVSYPADWRTNDGRVLPPCSLFDPSPIVVPEQSEIPFEIAIWIGVEETPFDSNPTSSQWERVLSAETVTVRGAQAVRVEVEATGEGLAERGMRSFRYAVDLGGGRTLVATTHDASPSYEAHKKVLARMMETIVLPVAEPAAGERGR